MKNCLLTFLLLLTLHVELSQAADTATGKNVMRSWTSITLGVASMEQALELWVDAFGFEVAARREGDDHGQVSTLAASGQAIHFYSPAGFWIEVFSE